VQLSLLRNWGVGYVTATANTKGKGSDDGMFIGTNVIRKTFYDGGIDSVISTRRLDHIILLKPSKSERYCFGYLLHL